ncbi:MAG: hypothetical protein O7E56_11675 [SAR324 cluster bacterium]|nr:hypothetical protein [SAR324 cluster bacterium]
MLPKTRTNEFVRATFLAMIRVVRALLPVQHMGGASVDFAVPG